MSSRRRLWCVGSAGLSLLVLVGCSAPEHPYGPAYGLGDDDDRPGGTDWDPLADEDEGEEEGDEEGETTGLPPKDETGDGGGPPPMGPCDGDEDCVADDATGCFNPQGTCEFSTCHFDMQPEGTDCDDGDACTEADSCTAEGSCRGEALACSFEHATGSCDAARGCTGPLTCDDGWADCNDDIADGCEADLSSDAHCGGCSDACEAGAHVASASCDAGTCTITCNAPWEDCDGDPGNGCEIPTRTPNRCDVNGLNDTTGCWTAHCGQSANPDARNFDDWYCFECTNCTEPSPGNVMWCSHSSGRWFPLEAGTCVVDDIDYEDLVCQ